MKYYITRTVGGITLYYDGEKFQPEQKEGKHYDKKEARALVLQRDFLFGSLTPVPYSDVLDMAINAGKL